MNWFHFELQQNTALYKMLQ